MQRQKSTKLNMVIWIIIVLVLSTLCYIPMLLDRLDVPVISILLNTRYLFVLIPLLVSIAYTVKEHNTFRWISGLFSSKNISHGIMICMVFIVVGISSSLGYNLFVSEDNLFRENYSGIVSVVIGFVYLFIMAMFEETAWRGFLLNRLSAKEAKLQYVLITGMIWGIWHIPMWSIRNMLNVNEIVTYFIWSMLLALILGTIFYKIHNVVILAILHTVFNMCYLAPAIWNNLVIAIVILLVVCIQKSSKKSIY